MKAPHVLPISHASSSSRETLSFWSAADIHDILSATKQDTYFQEIFQRAVMNIQLYFVKKTRVKKYVTQKLPYRKLISFDTTKKEVWDVWIEVPFLEERQLEPESNFHIRKIPVSSQKVVIKYKDTQVEVPPDPVKIWVNIPASLFERIEKSILKEDFHRKLEFFVWLLDVIYESTNSENTQIHICIIWENIDSELKEYIEEGFLFYYFSKAHFHITYSLTLDDDAISIFSTRTSWRNLLYYPVWTDITKETLDFRKLFLDDMYSTFISDTETFLMGVLNEYYE